MGAGRRHLGRAGLQPALGRVARAPVPARPAILRARVRPPLPRVLEPGRVRLQRPAPADHARRRDRPLPHAEALVESLQPAAAPHVHVAGHRRLGGARPLPARRHLQRHRRGRGAAPERARLQGSRPLAPQPAPLRLRATAAAGRRRRCSRRCAACATSRACRAPRWPPRDEFFAALEADVGELPDRRRGALLRVPPRHVHDPGCRQARATGRASGRCTTPTCWRRSPHGRPGPSIRAGGWRGLWQLLLLNQFHDILPGSSIALVYEDAARDHAEVRAGADAVAEAGLAALAGDGRRADAVQHDRLRAGPRSRLRRTAGSLVEAPPYGFGALGDRAGRGLGRRGGRRDRARERPPARGAGPRRRLLRSLVELETGREALAGPGNVLQVYDDQPDGVRRLGRRPVPPGDGRRLPGRDVVRGDVVRAAARRGRVRAAGRAGQHDAPGRAARRRRAAARVPLRGRLARVAHDAEGALPGGRAQPERDVPDAVRLHRAADALLDEPRPGPLRGARAPVRRPLRARLRRCAPHRLQVRLLDLRRTRCGSACCARRRSPTRRPTSAGTSSPTPSCRTPAAGARRAWSARRPGSRRRFAGRPAPPSRARSSQSTTRTWCSTR